MLLLNRCIQEPGAGDGPTSVVLDFLKIYSADDAMTRTGSSSSAGATQSCKESTGKVVAVPK